MSPTEPSWSANKIFVRFISFKTYLLGGQKYEEMLKSMIERISGTNIQCGICKRVYRKEQTTNLKNHIEAKHIDNIQFACCVCGGTFSSRASFRTHCRNFHREFINVPFEISEI